MRKIWTALPVALMIVALPACSEKTENSLANSADNIGQDFENHMDNAGAAIDNGLDDAGQAIENGTARMGAAADRAANDARENVGGALENAGEDLKKPDKE
ncbi:hypothetical protein GGR44_001433 [Sphingobium fontiphilum]|uniref:Phage-related protein n=1 Tax=Sphingobium fontiphilum TaxID=944425 RepID=A0A7W6DFS0_9SPHN|nr:hypothetical protein [Sphingobium fontiphilum]MBB3981774.1 hypothetical protein [Sphingobium fontiphilum]